MIIAGTAITAALPIMIATTVAATSMACSARNRISSSMPTDTKNRLESVSRNGSTSVKA